MPETLSPRAQSARRPAPDVFVFRSFVPDGAEGWAEVNDAEGRAHLAGRLLRAAYGLPVPTGPLRAQDSTLSEETHHA